MLPAKTRNKPAPGALGFEATLWSAAEKLKGNMDAAEYKHVVLGLIFLKYISDAFEEKHAALLKDKSADPEERDEYTADNIFWVNKIARWSYLQGRAKQPTIGKDLDDAIRPMIDRIIANIHESRTLADLRDALLPRLLSGELRVPVSGKEAVA